MAKENRDDARGDAADERQNQPRRGLEGKGFDAGTGYGGAGNASAYSGESSWGGQSGMGGNTLRGAFSGEPYGRGGAADERDPPRDAGRSAGGLDRSGISIPHGTDECDEPDAADDASRRDDVPARQVDPEGQRGASRRDPGR